MFESQYYNYKLSPVPQVVEQACERPVSMVKSLLQLYYNVEHTVLT